MSWFSRNEDKLKDSYDAVEKNLTQNDNAPLRGYNDEAMKLRGCNRGILKRHKEYGEQILEEEEKVISEDCSDYYGSESGKNLARKVVEKSFWNRFFNK